MAARCRQKRAVTILDLTPRLAAARRKQQAERPVSRNLSAGSAELVAAQMRFLLLPPAIALVMLDELGRYMDAMFSLSGAAPGS